MSINIFSKHVFVSFLILTFNFCNLQAFENKILFKIDNEIIDTLSLARDKFPGSQISLDALCKRYRIDNSKRVQHSALIDCDLLAKVYINLIDQKEPTLDFKNIIYLYFFIHLNPRKNMWFKK